VAEDRDGFTLSELAPRGLGPAAERHGLIGQSPALVQATRRIEAIAGSPATVLILGETGTGKELVARALHRASPRRDRPFLAHNFAAIPDSLVESELFGHARGAFTGAHADRPGLFELAHRGTLFLDEIGDASPSVQSRLLRVLQEGELRRVGENQCRRVDVRVVAATHRTLAEEVRAGRFRADLYYRLHVLTVRIPPLRERFEDIPLLATHVLQRLNREGRPFCRVVRAEALDRLREHAWLGNVRELEGVLERAVHAMGPEGVLTMESLGDLGGGLGPPMVRERTGALRERKRAFEVEMIRAALERAGGNKTRAARALGLTRQGLWKKLRHLETALEAAAVVAGRDAPDSP
jgi:two-component system response regulator HydG